MEKTPYEISRISHMQNPSFIIGWQSQDFGKLGTGVIDYLIKKLGGQEIGRIKPVDFFSFGSVKIVHDIVIMPESKFYACEKYNILLFKSDEPEDEWHAFLHGVLDVAQEIFKIKELFTINGNPLFVSHVQPRRMLTVCNNSEFVKELVVHSLFGMDYEGPPALSSFLLWVAKMRGVRGASIWVDIPFYFAALDDSLAQMHVLEFFNQRLSLHLDLKDLELEIDMQTLKITELMEKDPEIKRSLNLLESGIILNSEEQLQLARQIFELLGSGIT